MTFWVEPAHICKDTIKIKQVCEAIMIELRHEITKFGYPTELLDVPLFTTYIKFFIQRYFVRPTLASFTPVHSKLHHVNFNLMHYICNAATIIISKKGLN